MAFQPRTFIQILTDMIAYVRVHTTLTDFEIGSRIRTILEAAALEDDEQYFQMVQLLDAFDLKKARGIKLEGRLQEYDITRLQPGQATGEVVFTDENLIKDTVKFNVSAGATSLLLDSTDTFPTSGYPYTIRIGEGTVAEEDVTVSANNTTLDELTTSALVNAHSLGDRVSFVSGVADTNIPTGVQVQRRAQNGEQAVRFVTVEQGTLVNGDYKSVPVKVRAVLPGTLGNVGPGDINQFTSSQPFDGAAVTNESATVGGRNLETDEDLVDRGRAQIQSLSKATKLAITQAVIGSVDPVTGQRVSTANVLEKFTDDEVIVYVDDGTGFTPDTVILGKTTFLGNELVGVSTFTTAVGGTVTFPEEGWLLLSPESASQIELVQYSAVNHVTDTFTLVGTTANAHDAGDEIVLVDILSDSAEDSQNFFKTLRFPIVRNSISLWQISGPTITRLIEDTDFLLNRGNGQIELIGAGTAAGDQIIANYSYYTGLIYQAQRIINGDDSNLVDFPGVGAEGIIIVVETPTIRRLTVRASITAATGFKEADIAPLVQEVIENYITSLGIGQDFIIAEAVERAMGIVGMFNIIVTSPTSDLVVLEDELPVPFNSDGSSRVTVT